MCQQQGQILPSSFYFALREEVGREIHIMLILQANLPLGPAGYKQQEKGLQLWLAGLAEEGEGALRSVLGGIGQ